MASSSSALCVLCNDKEAIYTCPRCKIKTCTSICSSKHKKLHNCSGERDKAAYVPMNQYSWGTLMDDYTYLEDFGRKVSGWNNDIISNGIARGISQPRGAQRGSGRGRGRGGGGVDRRAAKGKREILKSQLENEDVYMDLLPVGMHRRSQNQSSWNTKTQSFALTIEYILHHPSEPSIFKIMSHRSAADLSLSLILSKKLAESKPDRYPSWVVSCYLQADNNTEALDYFMEQRRHEVSSGLSSQILYYKLDESCPHLEAFKCKSFIEFPRVEVWPEGTFCGHIVNEITGNARLAQPKRKKPRLQEPQESLTGMFGGYGSEDGNGPIALLDDYASDDDASSVEDQLSQQYDDRELSEPTDIDASLVLPSGNGDTELSDLECSDSDLEDIETVARLLVASRRAQQSQAVGSGVLPT